MNHELERESILRELAGARPSEEVQRRIVAGAFARMEKPRFSYLRPLLATAGAALAVTVGVVGLQGAPVAPAPALEAPAAGSARSGVGTFAVGPHRISLDGEIFFEGTEAGAARLRLDGGKARFEVEKLAAGETFEVRTPQVLVQVVGTAFEVARDGNCSSVEVTEGRVRVHGPSGARMLGAGERERFCEADPGAHALAGEALVREALVLVSRGQDLGRAATLFDRYRSENPQGPFAEEALFHLAVVRSRLGEKEEAQRLTEEFGRRYPGSARATRLQSLIARDSR